MKRLVPFILFVVLVLAGAVSLVVLLNPERHRAKIVDLLSKPLRRPVVIGPLSMGYFPPTLRLSQVAVMKEEGTPFLEMDSASAPLDLASLFHLKFVPAVLQFTHWKLMISRKPDGHWDIEDWLSGPSSGTGGHPSPPVSWTDGEIHWTDPYANPAQEVVLGSVSGAWDPAKNSMSTSGDFVGIGSPVHLSFAANGQFISTPQWAGDLQLSDRGDSCAIHIDNKAGTWDVKGGSVQWPLENALALIKFYDCSQATTAGQAKGLELHQWQFHATGNSSRVAFEHSAGISGGLSEAKGTLESGVGGYAARLQGAVKDVPVEVFRAIAGDDISLSGQVTGVAKDLQLAISSGTTALLSGQGYWELKDGRYSIPPGSMKRLLRARTMAYIKKKFPDLEVTGLPVSRLSAHWQIKDALVTINDGLLVSENIKAGWAGKIDSSRRGIDAAVRLEIHERDPKLAGLIPTPYQTQPAYGRLQGTWQEWILRSVPPSRISSMNQARLRKAINQK